MDRSRKLVLVIAGISALAMPVLSAQSDFNGQWRIEVQGLTGIDLVTMEITVTNGKVSGSITRTVPPGIPVVKIEDGTATVDTIAFTVKSGDGKRTITFTGKLKGNEISFAREAKGTGGSDGIYGLQGLKAVTARRVTAPQVTGTPPSAARLKFAAASVRPSAIPQFPVGPNRLRCQGVDGVLWSPNDINDRTPARQGRCTGGIVLLSSVLLTAYASSPTVRLVGFPFEPLTFYQIEAVADDPSRVTKAELKQMLQTLLEDRFKAQVHTTTSELDGFVLTVAKSGIKFKETSGDGQSASGAPILRGSSQWKKL